MVKTAQDIIIKPIITEHSMECLAAGKYTFKVAKVNTISVRGKMKRMGRNEGYTSSWKKAIVTLAEGSKTIEFFDGMI